MKQQIMEHVERKSLKKEVPFFEVGDTVNVHYRIREGEKERIQIFTGTVISRKGRGINEMFTVRRLVNDEGVERIFPIHSPNIVDVKSVRSGKTRRAKLYYLRERVGKAVKLTQRFVKRDRPLKVGVALAEEQAVVEPEAGDVQQVEESLDVKQAEEVPAAESGAEKAEDSGEDKKE